MSKLYALCRRCDAEFRYETHLFDDEGQLEREPVNCPTCEERSREEESAWARKTYSPKPTEPKGTCSDEQDA